MQPVIGLVGSAHGVARHWGELPVVGTPAWYVDRIAACGGRPVVLPGRVAADQLDLVDAVVLTGGGDIDPRRYGGTGAARDVDPDRDEADLAVAVRAAELGKPTLGVCRGLQILVVAFGGTLGGDLDMTHVRPEVGHLVRTEPGTLTRTLVGERPQVSALHEQAVADPGNRWRPTAWTDDGVVEAAEWVGDRAWPVLGVQWHPELDGTGPALFGWLLRQATQRSRQVA